MLRNVKDLRGYAIRATDGVIGKVDDFYFDDEDWGIHYLIVKTGSWLFSRKVLISPIALGHAGWMARELPVALTRAQVERQSRHRYQEAGVEAAGNRLPRLLRVSVLLGGWWPVGNGCVPGQPGRPRTGSTSH